MTSALAVCLTVLCLGLLFYRVNNSTYGIVRRFSDLIYLQKKKKCCFYYITLPSNCAIARCMSLTIPFLSLLMLYSVENLT